MSKTAIEWATDVWNPFTGCPLPLVSRGCDNCYARTLHNMRHKAYLAGKKLPKQYEKDFDQIQLFHDRLDEPLHWKKPRHIFVGSMGDLFHEDVPFTFIDQVLTRVVKCPQHTFMVLTKRPERMLEYYNHGLVGCTVIQNLWLGVTVEEQDEYDQITVLRDIPAIKRFISYEPMLGPIYSQPFAGISWIIIGPETGPKRRPCKPEWIKHLIDQTDLWNRPVFVKAYPMPDGRISKNMEEWPEWARRREFPG